MTPGEALRILAAMCDATWNGQVDSWTTADEISTQLLGYRGGTAQAMGSHLAALERRDLVESTRESWGGKSWRPAAAVRELLEPVR